MVTNQVQVLELLISISDLEGEKGRKRKGEGGGGGGGQILGHLQYSHLGTQTGIGILYTGC